jgi:hypothetical protein
MNQYFITISWYSTKNKLDKMLQEEINDFQHKVISENAIGIFRKIHENITAEYKACKGRGEAEFKQRSQEANYYITIGTSEINLKLVQGFITPANCDI